MPFGITLRSVPMTKGEQCVKKCGESKSLGSASPKYQTTANLKKHLKSKHSETFTKYLKNEEELKSMKRPRNEEVFSL